LTAKRVCSAYPDGEKTGFPDPLALRSISGRALTGGVMEMTIPFPKIDREAIKAGLEAALRLSRDEVRSVDFPIPTCFGRKWESNFSRIKENLLEKYGEKFSELIFLANRWLVYAGENAAATMRLCGAGNPEASETLKLLSTSSGYLEYEGMADTLFDALSVIEKPSALLKETNFTAMPESYDILLAMSLYWFFQAAESAKSNCGDFFDFLFEAMDAADLANGMYMWGEAEKIYSDSNSSNRNAAAELAKLRHRENYLLADEAIKYWRENIDPTLSASKAAEELLRIVPLSHKKLAELVSAEKKKM
jgi:hypothetical protein